MVEICYGTKTVRAVRHHFRFLLFGTHVPHLANQQNNQPVMTKDVQILKLFCPLPDDLSLFSVLVKQK